MLFSNLQKYVSGAILKPKSETRSQKANFDKPEIPAFVLRYGTSAKKVIYGPEPVLLTFSEKIIDNFSQIKTGPSRDKLILDDFLIFFLLIYAHDHTIVPGFFTGFRVRVRVRKPEHVPEPGILDFFGCRTRTRKPDFFRVTRTYTRFILDTIFIRLLVFNRF